MTVPSAPCASRFLPLLAGMVMLGLAFGASTVDAGEADHAARRPRTDHVYESRPATRPVAVHDASACTLKVAALDGQHLVADRVRREPGPTLR